MWKFCGTSEEVTKNNSKTVDKIMRAKCDWMEQRKHLETSPGDGKVKMKKKLAEIVE